MQKWEYMVLDVLYESSRAVVVAVNKKRYPNLAVDLFDALSDYGRQGWEAVGMNIANPLGSLNCDFIVLLKRPRE